MESVDVGQLMKFHDDGFMWFFKDPWTYASGDEASSTCDAYCWWFTGLLPQSAGRCQSKLLISAIHVIKDSVH